MPANRNYRWYCAVCGKKWSKDMASPGTVSPQPTNNADGSSGVDVTSVGDDSDSEDSSESGSKAQVVATKGVADTH